MQVNIPYQHPWFFPQGKVKFGSTSAGTPSTGAGVAVAVFDGMTTATNFGTGSTAHLPVASFSFWDPFIDMV